MDLKLLKKIKGLRTIEELREMLKLKRQTVLNKISQLKKQGYLTVSGGRQQKRIYKITTYKQTKSKGMFDIINKHSRIKVFPLFKHVTYGDYSEENALIDAIKLKNRRTLLAALSLFNHINQWKKLSLLAKKHKVQVQLGCLYDLARTAIKTRKMPKNIYSSLKSKKSRKIVKISPEKSNIIDKEWNCQIPFSREDLKRLKE